MGEIGDPFVGAAVERVVQVAGEMLRRVSAVESAPAIRVVVCGVWLMYFLVLVRASSVVEVSVFVVVDAARVGFGGDRVSVPVLRDEVEVPG